MRAAMKRTDPGAPPARRAARISTASGAIVLPAATPYEWELLCEHVVAVARQRGAVRLRIDGVDCVVRSEQAGVGRRCGGCSRMLRRVSFRITLRDLCHDCARRRLACEPDDAIALFAAEQRS